MMTTRHLTDYNPANRLAHTPPRFYMKDATQIEQVLNLPPARYFQLHRWPDKDSHKGGIIHVEPADLRQLTDGTSLGLDDLDPPADATELLDGPYLVIDTESVIDDEGADAWDECGDPVPEVVMQVIQNIYLGLCENAALQLVSDTNLSILLPESLVSG